MQNLFKQDSKGKLIAMPAVIAPGTMLAPRFAASMRPGPPPDAMV